LSGLGVGGLTMLGDRRWRRRRARRGICSLFSALPGSVTAGGEEDATMDLFSDMPIIEQAMLSQKSKRRQNTPSTVTGVKGELVTVFQGKGLGLDTKPGQMVTFDGGARAILLAWKESVGILQLLSGEVAEGETAKMAGIPLATRVGASTRGRIVNPRGVPLDGGPPIADAMPRKTFIDFKTMSERDSAYRSFSTGVLSVDFAVPIGRGQTMLFQGSDVAKDKALLWPDLMASRPSNNVSKGPSVNICICDTLEAAEALRSNMEARGLWGQCVVVVPESSECGAAVIAMNAAVAIAEAFNDKDGEAAVVLDLEPMHRVWNELAEAAMKDRGEFEVEDEFVEMDGTLIQSSIAERRKYWFALISRANNAKTGGSVSLLVWAWERQGGLDRRKQEGYRKQLERIAEMRLPEVTRQKAIDKVKVDAAALGIALGDGAEVLPEPPVETEGVPNWEIEELKSITDGHCLLRRPSSGDAWAWNLDPYNSLPRLGTDALHPALIATGAHKVRLKMLQGNDRAKILNEKMGSDGTLGVEENQLDIRFIELMLEQIAGKPMSIKEEVVRLATVSSPKCKALQAAPELSELNRIVDQVLASEAGARLFQQGGGKVTKEDERLLEEEIARC